MFGKREITKFVAADGRVIVFLDPHPRDGQVLLSADGVTFYAVGVSGGSGRFSGEEVDAYYIIDNPHDGTTGELHQVNNVIRYGGRHYVKQEAIVLVPLPDTRRVEYLCRFKDGRLLCVDVPVYNWDYESMRLFIGEEGRPMQSYRNYETSRYRDGGTTTMLTSGGSLLVPQRMFETDEPKSPTWRDDNGKAETLTHLDPGDFVVEWTRYSIIVTRR